MGIALADAYLIINKFVETNTPGRNERLRELLVNARSREKNVKIGCKRSKPNELTVTFCWFNFNTLKGKYTQVRELQGGGRRTKVVSRQSTIENIKVMARNIFFPDGKSRSLKFISDYSFSLGDYALGELTDMSMKLEEYIEEHSLKHVKTKFNFLTKPLTQMQKILSSVSNFTDDEDDDFLAQPTFSRKQKQRMPQVMINILVCSISPNLVFVEICVGHLCGGIVFLSLVSH